MFLIGCHHTLCGLIPYYFFRIDLGCPPFFCHYYYHGSCVFVVSRCFRLGTSSLSSNCCRALSLTILLLPIATWVALRVDWGWRRFAFSLSSFTFLLLPSPGWGFSGLCFFAVVVSCPLPWAFVLGLGRPLGLLRAGP